MGPHPMGSPVEKKEKRCILNLYQSFRDDGMSEKKARCETATRLGFGRDTVRNVIKEMVTQRDVTDNTHAKMTPNAYEKLDDEEIDDIRKIIHGIFHSVNNVKRLTEENRDIRYPTIDTVHQAVVETGRYPQWSRSTFRNILLSMGIQFQTKSETDSAILIEDNYIIAWRSRFLDNMELYRIQGRPIHYTNETYVDPNAQPRKMMMDITVESAMQAEEQGLSTGCKWNAGRGNCLLILHIIGPDGLLHKYKRVWIRSKNTVQSEDYHTDIDAKTFYDWFKEVLMGLPPNSVVVLDNCSIHNKREEGTPKQSTKKAEMQQWLMDKGVDFPPTAIKAQLWEIVKEHLKVCPEYSIDKLAAEIRPDVILERLPPYHCDCNAIEPVWDIPKDVVKSCPHKNVKDVRDLVSKAFDNVPDEFVQHCIEHAKEQEDYYRYLHGKKPLPTEEIEKVEDFDDDEDMPGVDMPVDVEEPIEDTTAISFDEEGQIVLPIEENAEVIEADVTPEDLNADSYTCEPCNFTTVSPVRWRRHLRSHHECGVCGKDFHGMHGLRDYKSHLKKHEQKKQHQCEDCGKSFAYLSFLTRHKNRPNRYCNAKMNTATISALENSASKTSVSVTPVLKSPTSELSAKQSPIKGTSIEDSLPLSTSVSETVSETSVSETSVLSNLVAESSVPSFPVDDQPRKRSRKQKLVPRTE